MKSILCALLLTGVLLCSPTFAEEKDSPEDLALNAYGAAVAGHLTESYLFLLDVEKILEKKGVTGDTFKEHLRIQSNMLKLETKKCSALIAGFAANPKEVRSVAQVQETSLALVAENEAVQACLTNPKALGAVAKKHAESKTLLCRMLDIKESDLP